MSATLVLDSSVFLRVWIDCLLLFRFPLNLLPFSLFCCRGLFLLQGKCAKNVILHHMQQAGALEFLHQNEMLLHNLWSFAHHSAHGSSSGWLFRSGRIDLLLAQKYELLQTNSRLLGCERVMETRAEFHFSWVYTFSATLSSLRNWANNDRYRLWPSTPAQLCWSSSRLQPLQNYNLRSPSALILFLHEIF